MMVLGIVKLITWKVGPSQVKVRPGSWRETGHKEAKRLPAKVQGRWAAHRFNPLNVKSTGCHICGHKDVNLFVLKAPRNSHKQMFTWILNPRKAPQEAEPAERTQILLDSSGRVQIVTVII